MKKNKILALGLIALVLAGGLVLAGCGTKCSNDGSCSTTVGGFDDFAVSACNESSCAAVKLSDKFWSGDGSPEPLKTVKCDC